ncbi:PAS domain-containing methyl-accepting chemotaxis protein [Massilia sp. TS11]|uniref:methyl-accepting chemotaxis protein n=1 Tax=Massilia sp. TS11 TaxID=2908003 RepID=UPI001EDAE9F1|nr:PAS domain-containing methyl-accepting chemotaxis protein [Massilia sp. TS11]MCG2585202.1 methyl-accepting chemotaxis protein [Massilia sp. TS11]
MRKNLPVQPVEVQVAPGHAIVSKTDLKGNIQYVNPQFVEVSGFSEEELLGQPQNIIRHPDMPPEAFADLWATIQAGKSWTGMVKNRCKDGKYYWVKANVTPVREHGSVTGYLSVRLRPTRDEIERAERGYRMINNREKGAPRIVHGKLVYPGWGALIDKALNASLAMRIWFVTSAVNTILITVCVASLFAATPAVRYAMFGVALLGFLMNVALWYGLHTGVLKPLGQALDGARTIAGGDLDVNFQARGQDEMGQLMRALEQMKNNLIATIGDVRTNVQSMGSATHQIAVGNLDLSKRTEAQAASLEESASSMEEFSSTVEQNAESSEKASEVAESAANVAREGGQLMREVVHTMDEISTSARKIAEFTGIIEGISFQTNILALNAAVEAARAGEQGRGFAVVAGEVRNLAQRAAAAAKEIKSLIDSSVVLVDAGQAQVHKAGDTMEGVVQQVQQVAAFMGDISRASREQSIGIAQVNEAIVHMDQVTQQNAALVEEAAAAAASLDKEAQALMRSVELFRLAGVANTARPAAVRRLK